MSSPINTALPGATKYVVHRTSHDAGAGQGAPSRAPHYLTSSATASQAPNGIS